MEAAAITYTIQYPFASYLETASGKNHLHISASKDKDTEPLFFYGIVKKPRLSALCLLSLSRVVRSRFYIPPAMLQRILLEADPVVICDRSLIRFEGFSSCCSTHCRVDFSENAFSHVQPGRGTTNVDFGTEMRTSLAKIRDSHHMTLEIGAKQVSITHGDKEIVEKKVPLPVRWLKGFGAVQSYQSRMKKILSMGRPEAVRFFKSIRQARSPGSSYYLQQTGKHTRLTQHPGKGLIKISGIERLLLLENIIPFANEIHLYATMDNSATSWAAVCDHINFYLTLSSDVWRGFSGEGTELSNLKKLITPMETTQMKASLMWEKSLGKETFAQRWELDIEDAERILAHFANMGLLGYDILNETYFYRRLPFDLKPIEQLQPRLKKANRIVENGDVDFENKDQKAIASVLDGETRHQVLFLSNQWQCTCTWYAKHKNERGPCSHILAVEMSLEKQGVQQYVEK